MKFDFGEFCAGLITTFVNLLLSGLVAITALYLCSMCNPNAQYSIFRQSSFELVFITTLILLFLYPRKEIGVNEEVEKE
jgi:hypothetical protein